jgi:hypothetical protein
MSTNQHAAAPLRQPDVFERSVYLTCEIEAACQKAKQAAMAMKVGRITRSHAGMKAAAEELERHLRQARSMNDALQIVLAQDRTADVINTVLAECAGEGEV